MFKRVLAVILIALLVLQVVPVSNSSASVVPHKDTPMMGVVNRAPYQAETFSYDFVNLKQSVGLWADGKGNVLIDQTVRNTSSSSSDVFNNLTWWFNWPAGTYTQISAKDDQGPLHVDTSTSGTYIYVTVNFRHAVVQNGTYHFKLFITISGMANGSGDNWSINWYTQAGMIENGFTEVVAIPANATIGYADPTPTEQHGNILTWYVQTPGDWTLSLYVPYTLSSQISVPFFYQQASPWGTQIYAHNTSPTDTMTLWGCLTTAGDMLAKYFANTQQRSLNTNPGVLNTWLINNNGYTVENYVNHAWFGKYARANNVSMYWDKSTTYDYATVDYYLRSGYPVILGVKPTIVDGKTIVGHYVLAVGESNDGSFTINDPYYGITTLKSQWNNYAMTMILFSASEADQQLLYFTAQSPIEFVVTDPLGQQSGYNPNTGTLLTNIPGSDYLWEGLAPTSGSSAPIFVKALTVPDPVDGIYNITVYGTGTGSYNMEVSSMDWMGVSFDHVYAGTTTPGHIDNLTTTYKVVAYKVMLPIVRK